MEERELTVDDLAIRADEGDVSYFAYGGPVGEDMATEMQPSVSYFADGGSVDAQMLSIPDRPQYVGPSASAVQGPTAAQMLQSFADGGLVDSAAARMAMGAPAENLFGANLAAPKPVAAPNYTFNLPTFNPTPVNFNGVTNPTVPALTFAGTQQVTPAPGAKTLYEQIAPSTFAAAPYDFSKAATSFTPTAQTFAKPTLLSAEEAIKQQPVLVRYQPDIKFGGLQTYQGPLQTSPYKDEEPSAPAQGPVGIGGLPTAATPAITRTPLGYEYSPYATLTPEQIAGSGNRAQVTDMFKGIVDRQQKDVDNLRIEYNQAMAVGNMPLANQLKGILTAQEQELATAKADQLNANKYFTGVGGAFETPEMLRQRVLGEQFKALKLGDELAFRGVDLGGIQVAAGAQADPFTAELTRQQNEATAAQNVYNRLVGAYGKDSQIAKDYLSQTLTPQQQEYQNMLALTRPAKGAVAPTNIFSAITAGEAYKGFTAPKLAEIRNVVQTENVYKPIITGFETNINNLVRAREQADSLGLSGYSNRLNQLIETENAKLEQARGERQSAIDRAQPDPMRDFILGKQLSAQKIEGFTGVDIGNVDFGKMQAAAFDPVITRQQQDVNAAQNTYNQLVSLYGANNDTTKAFLNDVLNPQKAELKQATDLKTAAGAAIGAYNTGRNYGYLNPPNIAVSRATKDETINKAYDDFIRNNYEKRIATLDAAKAKAEQAGLGQYGDYFNQLMDTQRSYIDRTNQARDALFAKRDAATRAKGSPPEGEVADSRSRALLKKLSGGGEATTAPLQKFAKGGAVKKAAELLKGLGVSEGKVAGKELTTLQDTHTSLGDAVRERATKSKQMMDAMEFKYGPGQYVFTESSARKNLSPLEIKAKRLYGDQPVRETPASKASRDPVTGKVLRTPYEPGYLVRQQMPEGDWAEYVIPESAIKGTVDGFKHGGPVHRAQGSPVYGEMPDTGPITEDTRAAMRGSGKFSASEAARMLRNIAGEGVSNIESLLRGSVAAIPGSVGDIESIFRESDKTRKFATTEEVLRDYMPKRATKPTKEAAGMEEVGSYLPLPVPAGTATKVAKGAKKGAKKALEELGPTAGRMAERQLQKAGLGPMYAVKPKGGTFYPPSFGSYLDDYLEDVVRRLDTAENLAGKDAETVANFIRTKGRKYLTTDFGTSDDPLRVALYEGRLPRVGRDKELFRTYALEAARGRGRGPGAAAEEGGDAAQALRRLMGDPEAALDLEKAYDEATGLRAKVVQPYGQTADDYRLANRVAEQLRNRMIAEGTPEELALPITPNPRTVKELSSSYMQEGDQNLARVIEEAIGGGAPTELRSQFPKDVETMLYATTKQEPIYDIYNPRLDFLQPRNLAQGIASIPVNELQRMSFPEAVIKGLQNTRLARDWDDVISKAQQGKTLPKNIFLQGTSPVYEVDKNQQWVRIMTPDAVELEGAAMRHSIGGYKTSRNYNLGGKQAFESGLARIFSLRNEKGVPQVTVETKFTDEDGLTIREVRSKFNSEPTAEEKRAVFQLFDTLGPRDINSTKYRTTRTGESLAEADQVTVDWGNEYQDYLKYKNKGEE